MQGSFNVFTEHHRGRIKDLRFKPMHRHLFLYEKSFLLCKKKEESPTGLEKGVYVFKNLLQVSHSSLEFLFYKSYIIFKFSETVVVETNWFLEGTNSISTLLSTN